MEAETADDGTNRNFDSQTVPKIREPDRCCFLAKNNLSIDIFQVTKYLLENTMLLHRGKEPEPSSRICGGNYLTKEHHLLCNINRVHFEKCTLEKYTLEKTLWKIHFGKYTLENTLWKNTVRKIQLI